MPAGCIAQVCRAAAAALEQAAADLGRPSSPGAKVSLSPETGALTSPYPKVLGVPPSRLAQLIPSHPDLLRCYASGQWLCFDLSADWWRRARTQRADGTPLPLPPLPRIPDFPARISPLSWTLNALLGSPRPETAARLDRGNPAVLIQLAQQRAGLDGAEQENRPLAALALLALEETQPRALTWGMLRLARSYLRAPGEGGLVSRSLARGLSALGGGQI